MVNNSLPIHNASGTPLIEEAGATGTGIKHVDVNTMPGDNNLSSAIRNPMTFYYASTIGTNIGRDWYTATDDRTYQNDDLWGGESITTPSAKTIYDPCPAGWRVPAWSGGSSPWDGFDVLNPSGTADTQDEYLNFPWYSSDWATGYGRIFNQSESTYYPAAGYRNYANGSLGIAGSLGYYWSASSDASKGFRFGFSSASVFLTYSNDRVFGFLVRCVQE